MKKIKILSIGLLCALLMCSVAVGCSGDTEPTESRAERAVLADFEKWAPDFQMLRLRNEFGAVDVNNDAEHVKSGSGSAALTVVGASGSEKPYFFVNTVSTLFGYDYSDFSKTDSVSAWVFSTSETEENLYIGLITKIVSVEQAELQKYETFALKPGWNEIVYKPDMNYVISSVGADKYSGIEGVYFMFDNPHAASKADGKKFFIDDIVLHYGEEKPFTEVRAGTYYSHGSQIGPSEGLVLDTPVSMENLNNKALAFDFRFESEECKFGFAVMCLDGEWWNVTGTLIIEKKADGTVEANMGRIVAQDDGWYTWMLNSEFFGGDGAAKAKDISLIYHQGETVQGNVIIDWKSMRATDAYEVTKEERSETFVEGQEIAHYFYEKGIAMSALENKAMQLEFKFTSDTGRFGFAFLDNLHEWVNITGSLVVTKNSDGTVTANIGKVVALENGWYAWQLNRDLFTGGGVGSAVTVDLVWHNNGVDGFTTSVLGTVMIDWSSFSAVDAYATTREDYAEIFTDGDKIEHNFGGDKIAMTALADKSLSFEFKFATETGKFGFNVENMGHSSGQWKSVTGDLMIEKTAQGVTANRGIVTQIADGWYSWQLNSSLFAGNGATDAEYADLAYHYDIAVEGTIYIDWNSWKVADAYPVSDTDLTDVYFDGFEGTGDGRVLRVKDYTITELSNAVKRSGEKSLKIHVRKGNSSVAVQLDSGMKEVIGDSSQLSLWVNVTAGTCDNLIGSVYNKDDGDLLGARATVATGENGTWRKITFDAEQTAEIKTIGAITLYCDFGTNGSGVVYVDDLELTEPDTNVTMTVENKSAKVGTQAELADFSDTMKFNNVNRSLLTVTCNGAAMDLGTAVVSDKLVYTPQTAGEYVFVYTHRDGHKVVTATQTLTAYVGLADPYLDGFEGTGNRSVLQRKPGVTWELSGDEKHGGTQSMKIAVDANNGAIVLQLDSDMLAAMTNSMQLSLWVNITSGTCGNLIGAVYKAADGDYLGSRGTVAAGENGTWRKITFDAEQTAEIKTIGAITLYFDFGASGGGIAYVDDLILE